MPVSSCGLQAKTGEFWSVKLNIGTVYCASTSLGFRAVVLVASSTECPVGATFVDTLRRYKELTNRDGRYAPAPSPTLTTTRPATPAPEAGHEDGSAASAPTPHVTPAPPAVEEKTSRKKCQETRYKHF